MSFYVNRLKIKSIAKIEYVYDFTLIDYRLKVLHIVDVIWIFSCLLNLVKIDKLKEETPIEYLITL